MKQSRLTTSEFMIPLILITSLFFLWGIANGWIADIPSMSIGFLAPVPCFVLILFYALNGHKIKMNMLFK
jgi:fucose permease